MFKIHYGMYRTPDNSDEQPFASYTIDEGQEAHHQADGIGDLHLDAAGDPEVRIAKCNGKVVYADIIRDGSGKLLQGRTEVAPGVYCQVKAVLPPLTKRVHPDGKKCQECLLWSHEKGIQMLNMVHTKYQENLELRMYREVSDQVASNYGLPMLTNENVGYCPKNSELCADVTPACEEGFMPHE